MSKNVNMTEFELNSVDLMIAYLEANDKSVIDSNFDALFANNNCFGIMAITVNSTCISGWIGQNENIAINDITKAVMTAAAGGAIRANDLMNVAFFEKLSNGKKPHYA